jgi:hypothetical protein
VTIEPLAVLMGAPEGELRVGSGTLIAPHAYLQGLGGVRVGERVGVGAGVLMLTAVHAETPPRKPITAAPLRYGPIEVEEWSSGVRFQLVSATLGRDQSALRSVAVAHTRAARAPVPART